MRLNIRENLRTASLDPKFTDHKKSLLPSLSVMFKNSSLQSSGKLNVSLLHYR